MKIYFYNDRNRYIGNRELEDNETQPEKTTLNPVELHDGEEAYLVGGEWVVSKIMEEITE